MHAGSAAHVPTGIGDRVVGELLGMLARERGHVLGVDLQWVIAELGARYRLPRSEGHDTQREGTKGREDRR